MNHQEEVSRDPYAPPPRHRDRSGAILRVGLLAVLLGAAAWGFMAYDDGPSLVAEAPIEQTQRLADSSLDAPLPESEPLVVPPSVEPAPAGR